MLCFCLSQNLWDVQKRIHDPRLWSLPCYPRVELGTTGGICTCHLKEHQSSSLAFICLLVSSLLEAFETRALAPCSFCVLCVIGWLMCDRHLTDTGIEIYLFFCSQKVRPCSLCLLQRLQLIYLRFLQDSLVYKLYGPFPGIISDCVQCMCKKA